MAALDRCLVIEVTAGRLELTADRVWVLGAIGVEERVGPTDSTIELVVGFADATTQDAAEHALRAAGEVVRVLTLEPDWLDGWREFARPVWVSPNLVVTPPWQPVDLSDGVSGNVTVLTIDPGRAFGSGGHPTTSALVRLVHVHAGPGDRVLDVGCGSGILSIVAAHKGAAVVAIDIDPEALIATRANAQANGVSEALTISSQAPADLSGSFDLIVANIPIGAIEELASALTDRLSPGGSVLVSGLLEQNLLRATEVFADFDCVTQECHEGWLALVFERR